MDLLLASGRSQTNVNKRQSEAAIKLGATPARVDTSSLNALKVIALLWIIAGHCLYYLASVVSNNSLMMLYTNQISSFALINGAIYITELFFVITGCLSAYLTFKYNTRLVSVEEQQLGGDIMLEMRQQQGNAKNESQLIDSKQVMEPRLLKLPFWALATLNRYLRIVPTYLLVYALIKLVTIYIGGEGGLWDYAVSPNSVRRACIQEPWWPLLTLTTNFLEIHEHCIVGGWYLSVDFQFALMAVPLMIILARSQRGRLIASRAKPTERQKKTNGDNIVATISMDHNRKLEQLGEQRKRQLAVAGKRVVFAYGILLLAALLSAFSSILHAIYRSHIDLSILLKFTPHQVSMLSPNFSLYTNSIYRFRAFSFGLIVGHALYLYESKLINLPKLVQQHGTKLTTLIFFLGAGIMFIPVLYPFGKIKISHDMTAILAVLTASGIDIFLCSLIFLICIGKAPKAVLFVLNSPLWSIFSAPALSAFLVHTEVITLLTSQYDTPPSIGWNTLLFLFCTATMITYSLALVIHLTFEMPTERLIDAVMQNYVLRWRPFRSRIITNKTEYEESREKEQRLR